MAINMMCMNSECKYYWEDMCTRNVNEERIFINADGKCVSFEKGKSDWYEDEEKAEKVEKTSDKKFNCYDCIWATDKCKMSGSDQYNKFLKDIEKCNFVGEVDNSLGCSFNKLSDDNI
ncbi:hypothetical protein [Marinisporobacter balticus]|uniref:Uncharacterized protein n=1 Tax=Marinisporobacter balticus TaxID=2018667 RepID=A0A4R2KGE7_9FIRM|nr:hypothetical protein [Marinisporobacter balticus]TCO69526.1 hypothetical protein EV214_13150 [Marinisporobacter balticus]